MSSRILAFGGSLRRESFNQKLAAIAADGARSAGANVTLIRLADFPMPVYDGDIEAAQGLPESVVALKQLFGAHDGLLIANPEYNGSITAALKNAIDWVSRPAEGEAPLACFDGKISALVSCSPGGLGGLRGLVHTRAILGNIRVTVLPDQHAIGGIHDKMDDAGRLTSDTDRDAVLRISRRLAEVCARMTGAPA